MGGRAKPYDVRTQVDGLIVSVSGDVMQGGDDGQGCIL
jgi:hypothetical protein